MNNENLLAVLDALGERLAQKQHHLQLSIDDCNEMHERAERLRMKIGSLETEIREKTEVIEKLERALMEGKPMIYCVKCKSFETVACNPAVRSRCKRWDIRFTEFDGAINPHFFSCPFAEEMEAANA